jgi:hypothetical protein
MKFARKVSVLVNNERFSVWLTFLFTWRVHSVITPLPPMMINDRSYPFIS